MKHQLLNPFQMKSVVELVLGFSVNPKLCNSKHSKPVLSNLTRIFEMII